METLGRAAVLLAAFTLCTASARRGSPARQGRGLVQRKDRQLHHPALQVVNSTDEVVNVSLRGPVRRRILAPPREQARTLLAAGSYLLEVRRGRRLVRREKIRLRKGHRYRLEIAP